MGKIYISQMLHVWNIYHQFKPNVGKHTSPMDHLGIIFDSFCILNLGHATWQSVLLVAGGKTRFEVFQGENRWTKNKGPKKVSYFHIGKAVQNDSPKLMEQIAFQEFSQKVMQDDCKFTKLLSKKWNARTQQTLFWRNKVYTLW